MIKYKRIFEVEKLSGSLSNQIGKEEQHMIEEIVNITICFNVLKYICLGY